MAYGGAACGGSSSYKRSSDGRSNGGYEVTTSMFECEAAASSLGLVDTVVDTAVSQRSSSSVHYGSSSSVHYRCIMGAITEPALAPTEADSIELRAGAIYPNPDLNSRQPGI
jgi:hypothetical protein